MSIEIGKKASVGIGKETTKGTAVTPTYWLPVEEKNIGIVAESVNNEADFGEIVDVSDGKIVYSKGEPSFSGIMYDKSFGLLLLSLLGAVTTTADTPESGVNSHAFSLSNGNDHTALTIAFKDGNQDVCIPYAKLSTLAINFAKRDFVKYSAAFIGQKKESDTNTVAYVVENLFAHKHFSLKLADDVAGLAAASAIDVISANVNFEKNLFEHDALGYDEPAAIYNGLLTCNVDVEMLMDNTTYQAMFEAGTSKVMQIELNNSDVTIGLVSHPKLTLQFHKVQLQAMDGGYTNGDFVQKKFTAKCMYNLTTSKFVTATLINTATSY